MSKFKSGSERRKRRLRAKRQASRARRKQAHTTTNATKEADDENSKGR